MDALIRLLPFLLLVGFVVFVFVRTNRRQKEAIDSVDESLKRRVEALELERQQLEMAKEQLDLAKQGPVEQREIKSILARIVQNLERR